MNWPPQEKMTRVTLIEDVAWNELTATQLMGMPTLSTGQADDLKFDDGKYRVWLARGGLNDWEGCEDKFERVMYEKIVDGRWKKCDRYGRLKD